MVQRLSGARLPKPWAASCSWNSRPALTIRFAGRYVPPRRAESGDNRGWARRLRAGGHADRKARCERVGRPRHREGHRLSRQKRGVDDIPGLVDPDPQAAPLKVLAPPFGVYFATGNHDEFGDTARYLAALKRAGVRVLANEKVVVEGLQILGVPHHDSTSAIRLKAALDDLQIDRAAASILINHVPSRLEIVESAGVSLQVSGHTHGGQFLPFTWITQRIFGKFTYGLHAYGKLQVFTSYGAGTWGPPMRVGTSPEVVLLRFE